LVFLRFGFIWLQFVSDFELRISNLQLTLPLLSSGAQDYARDAPLATSRTK
jgi:hypothetical protein